MNERLSETALTRRAVLGGLGAGAGLGVLTATLPAGIAGAAPAGLRAGPTVPATLLEQATPLNSALSYVLTCGHDFSPLESPSTYTTLDGQFRFGATSSGYASVLPNLPIGSVIKELEVYGTRTATGSVSLELWKSTVAAGTVALSAHAAVPAVAGNFTTTLACNDAQDAEFKSTPFVNIDSAAAPTTAIFGMRVGYLPPAVPTPPPAFTPLPTSIAPRVYDSRVGGLTKLGPGEQRVIPLPVPAVIGAAVFTLTLTETEGVGGYVAAFQADIPWPGNSSVNWYGPDQNIANTVVCAVSADSKIALLGGANRTHVIVDVAGWLA